MLKRTHFFLFLSVLIYLTLRGLILATSFDAVVLPGYELFPMGNIAKDLIEGGGFPLINYCDSHSGGELVTGLLATLFYLVLGSTYLALKMVPLFFGLGTLVILYFFLRDNFSSRAASIGALLFALSPTTMTKHSLLAMGNHFEILFFLVLLLFCFYRYHTRGYRTSWLMACGLIAGFSLFHNFSSFLVILLLGAVHFGTRGFLKTARDLLCAAPFFLLGIIPLMLINLGTRGAGSGFLQAKFLNESLFDPGRTLERFGVFLTEVLPVGGCFESFLGLPGRAAEWAWLCCFLLAYALFLPCFLKGIRLLLFRLLGRTPPSTPFTPPPDKGDAPPLAHPGVRPGEASFIHSPFQCLNVLPLGLYLPLLGLAYALGDFRFGGYPSPHEAGGYRYLLTHFLFAIMLISIGAARLSLSRRGAWVRAAGFLLAAACLAAGLFNFSVVDFTFSKPRLLGQAYAGYYYPQFSRGLFGKKYRDDPSLIGFPIQGFRPVFQCRVYAGIGLLRAQFDLRPIRKKPGTRSAQGNFRLENLHLPRLLSGLPEKHKIDAARGGGSFIRELLMARRPFDETGIVEILLNGLKSHPCPQIPYLLEGLMLNRGYILETNTKGYLWTNRNLIEGMPPEIRPDLWRGHGIFCGRILRRGIATEEEAIHASAKKAPLPHRRDFYFGLGFGAADGGDEPALPRAFGKVVPAGMQPHAMEGFGAAMRHLFGPSDACHRFETMRKDFPESLVPHVFVGIGE